MKRKKKSNRGEKKKTWVRGLNHQFYLFRKLEHKAWSRIVILTLLEQRPMCRADLAAQYSEISGYHIPVEQLQKHMVALEKDRMVEFDHMEKGNGFITFRYFNVTQEGLKERDLMVDSFNEFVPLIEKIIEETH